MLVAKPGEGGRRRGHAKEHPRDAHPEGDDVVGEAPPRPERRCRPPGPPGTAPRAARAPPAGARGRGRRPRAPAGGRPTASGPRSAVSGRQRSAAGSARGRLALARRGGRARRPAGRAARRGRRGSARGGRGRRCPADGPRTRARAGSRRIRPPRPHEQAGLGRPEVRPEEYVLREPLEPCLELGVRRRGAGRQGAMDRVGGLAPPPGGEPVARALRPGPLGGVRRRERDVEVVGAVGAAARRPSRRRTWSRNSPWRR